MRILVVPLLAAALLGAVVSAPGRAAPTFETRVGGEGTDRGVGIRLLADGGYAAVGLTDGSGEGGEDVYLARLDESGRVRWTRTYGGPGADNGWVVHEAPDGFVLAGFTDSFGAGGFDFYLLKTDAEGNAEWSRTFGGPADDRCWALAARPDGGFLLAGETKSFGNGEEDWYVVAVDDEGREAWSRTYGGERGDRCFSVAATGDGGFVLAGQTYSWGEGERDAYVARIDAEGKEEWSRIFGGAERDLAHHVIRTSDGAFVLTGYTRTFGESPEDPYLIKLDPDGNKIWTRVHSLPGGNRTLSGAETADGGLVFGGFTQDPSTGRSSALVLRTDRDGVLLWWRDVRPVHQGQTIGYAVAATADGGCVFAGHTPGEAPGELDLLVAKVEAGAAASE